MQALKYKEKKIFSLKTAKRIVIMLLFVLIFDFFLFPAPAIASEFGREDIVPIEIIEPKEVVPEVMNNLPSNSDLPVAWDAYYTITAYNSEIGQCDVAPCITANGFNVCEHGIEDTVAANFLKFGTKIKIPDLFGDRVFVVRDRMSKKHDNRVDVWMLDKSTAKNFGIRIAKIEVLEGH